MVQLESNEAKTVSLIFKTITLPNAMNEPKSAVSKVTAPTDMIFVIRIFSTLIEQMYVTLRFYVFLDLQLGYFYQLCSV